jgi:hypothetical protein
VLNLMALISATRAPYALILTGSLQKKNMILPTFGPLARTKEAAVLNTGTIATCSVGAPPLKQGTIATCSMGAQPTLKRRTIATSSIGVPPPHLEQGTTATCSIGAQPPMKRGAIATSSMGAPPLLEQGTVATSSIGAPPPLEQGTIATCSVSAPPLDSNVNVTENWQPVVDITDEELAIIPMPNITPLARPIQYTFSPQFYNCSNVTVNFGGKWNQ